ncbi:hypothetical protein [Mycobacterium tuberculosis]|uniref:hypothetical protein n=1 Tax=Mycobacterium tuberculosis TaxID=1773 RepID=UPI0011265E24
MPDLTPDHPAVEAAARAALAEGWTCDTHEPQQWGSCPDCTDSHLRTAHRALTAALPYLTADAARAVIRVEELADEFDTDAATCAIDPDLDPSYADGARDTAARIRTALDGETND